MPVSKAAKLLCISRQALYKKIASGHIKAKEITKLGRKTKKYLIDPTDLLKKNYLTPLQLSNVLKITRQAVYYKIKKGWIKTYQCTEENKQDKKIKLSREVLKEKFPRLKHKF